jgi:hypothetical protein
MPTTESAGKVETSSPKGARMFREIHIGPAPRLAFVGSLLVVVAGVAPAAQARHAPGEDVTGARPPASVAQDVPRTEAFDWGDATIGAGVATLVLSTVGGGAALRITRRESRAVPDGNEIAAT